MKETYTITVTVKVEANSQGAALVNVERRMGAAIHYENTTSYMPTCLLINSSVKVVR